MLVELFVQLCDVGSEIKIGLQRNLNHLVSVVGIWGGDDGWVAGSACVGCVGRLLLWDLRDLRDLLAVRWSGVG